MEKQTELRWGHIVTISNPEERNKVLAKELMAVGKDLMLTDCIANYELGGAWVLIMLDNITKTSPRNFKLKCIHDQWGTPYKPGDLVEWKQSIKQRDQWGNKFTRAKMDSLRRSGKQRDPIEGFEQWGSATVDETGCITIPYADAMILLTQFGIHHTSGEPLTTKKDVSRDPIKVTVDGKTIHKILHNWRFSEVRMTETLEPIQPKRTRKPKSDDSLVDNNKE